MAHNELYNDGSLAQLNLLNQQIDELKKTIAHQNELLRSQSETIDKLENGFKTAKLAWWTLELPSGNVNFHPLKAMLLGYEAEQFKTYQDFVKLLHPNDTSKAMAAMHNYLSGKASRYEIEYRILCADGTYKWLFDSGEIIHKQSSKGKTTIRGIVQDISDKKKVEVECEIVKNRFCSLLNSMDEKVFIKDASLRFVFANQSLLKFLDKSMDEILGKTDLEILPLAIAEKCFKDDLETLKNNRLTIFENSVNGRIMESHKFPVQINKNETGLGCYTIDITEPRTTEQKMQAFAAMMEQNDSIVVVKDLDLKVIATNSAFARAAGLSSVAELIGKTDAEIFNLPPETEPICTYMSDEIKVQQFKRGEFLIKEEPLILPNGEIKTLYTKKYPIYNEKNQLIATGNISTDISELKKYEKDIINAKELAEKNQKRFEHVASHVGEFIWEVDSRGIYIYANKSVEKILGYQPHELIGQISCFDLLHPQSPPEKTEIIRQYISNHEPLVNLDCILMSKSGNMVNVITNGIPLLSPTGELIGYQGSIRDVTEQLKYESKLQEHETNYRQLVENLEDVLFTLNKDGIIEYISPSVLNFSGFEAHNYVGRAFIEFIHPEDLSRMIEKFQLVQRGIEETSDYRILTKSGDEVWVRSSTKAMINEKNETVYNGIAHNITEQRKAEQTLKESEQKFATAFHSSPYPMLLTDTITGGIIEVNQAFCQNTGYNAEEITGNTHFERGLWKNPSDREEFASKLDSGEKVIEQPYVFLHKNGKEIIGLVTAQAIRVNNETIIMASINNITERKEAEDAILRQDALLMAISRASHTLLSEENMDLAMTRVMEEVGQASHMDRIYLFEYHVDPANGENLMSQRYEWVKDGISMQINNKQLQNLSFDNLFPRWLKAFKKGESISGLVTSFPLTEQSILLPQDIISLLVVPVQVDGQFWGFLGFDDCNGKSQWTEGDHAILETLAASLGAALSRSINEENLRISRDKAQESVRLKTAFLQNISHEIRTPMNAIFGFIGFLDDPEIDEDEKRMFIDLIARSSKRLLNTINNIVEISKIDAGIIQVSRRDCNVDDLMIEVFEDFMSSPIKKDIAIKLQADIIPEKAFVSTDFILLNTILLNLLDNAVKFTESGTITIGSYLERQSMIFFVKDTGLGIHESQHQIIFDRFIQGTLQSKQTNDGAGLGLAICKAYAEALGGRIWVESELNKGSVFYLQVPYIPIRTHQPIPDREVVINPAFSSDSTILVVEDELINYHVLELMLKEHKFNLLHADCGETAISMVKKNQDISLVLMDIKMSDIDGYEATSRIRQFNKTIPIIAQTAYVSSEDREKALISGCNDFIPKPIQKEILLKMIRKYLI